MPVRLGLKIKAEALACQEFMFLRGGKKGETCILKAKSLISGGSPPQCVS